MAKRLFDGAAAELGYLPFVDPTPPASSAFPWKGTGTRPWLAAIDETWHGE